MFRYVSHKNVGQYLQSVMPMLVVLAGLLLSSCASTPRVSVQSAPDLKIQAYKTFGFYSPLGTDSGEYGTLLSQKLKTATRAALESKGLVFQEKEADLMVNFNVTATQKADVNSMPVAHPYGWRGGVYSPWVGYNNVSVHQYTEGRLVVDLVDRAGRNMIWEGTAVAVISSSPDKNSEKINLAIAEMFREFPAR